MFDTKHIKKNSKNNIYNPSIEVEVKVKKTNSYYRSINIGDYSLSEYY